MTLCLAASSPATPILLCAALLLAAGGVVYCGYYGLQSLAQAAALGKPVPFTRLAQHEGKTVALRGQAQLLHEPSDPFKRCLWIKTVYQSWHSGWGGGRRGWRTTSTEVQGFDFVLKGGEVEVLVHAEDATEVHGAKGPSRFSPSAMGTFGSGDHRVLRRRLPVGLVTVCGMLTRSSQGYVLERDDEAGLLLSSLGSDTQAKREKLKGILSLTALPVAWILAAVWCIRNVF